MANFQPRRIIGKWSQGYALDLHTVSSVFLGHDQYGHAQYDNTYSEVGQLLFRLKYRSNQSGVEELAEAVERFMKEWNPGADIIVPVPPSNQRAVQPVFLLAEAISKRLVVHRTEDDGYSRFSFSRASVMEKRQSIVACSAFRWASHAAVEYPSAADNSNHSKSR
jgi:hypothetical protein